MKLFEVSSGRRVLVTSAQIRWAEARDDITVLGENLTWSGTTTGHYWFHEGVQRRLIVEHDLGFYQESGVWQRDVECYVIG